jgi:hypothetical protein
MKKRQRKPYPHVFEINAIDGELCGAEPFREWLRENGVTPYRVKAIDKRPTDVDHVHAIRTMSFYSLPMSSDNWTRVEIKDPDHAFWFKMRFGTDVARFAREQETARSIRIRLHDFGKRQPSIGPYSMGIEPVQATSYARKLTDADREALAMPLTEKRKVGLPVVGGGHLMVSEKVARRIAELGVRGTHRTIHPDAVITGCEP